MFAVGSECEDRDVGLSGLRARASADDDGADGGEEGACDAVDGDGGGFLCFDTGGLREDGARDRGAEIVACDVGCFADVVGGGWSDDLPGECDLICHCALSFPLKYVVLCQ